MALFLIAYRPGYPEDNLRAVKTLIESWGGKHLFDLIWLVDRTSSEKFIFDAIYEHINQITDSVVIARIDNGHCFVHRYSGDLSGMGIQLSDR